MTTKAVYWILTVPNEHFLFPCPLPPSVIYVKGQQERGVETDYLHWQLVVTFNTQVRLPHVKRIFGTCHAEPSRSKAADEYVWKDDTAIPDTRFQLGKRPLKRNCDKDWAAVLDAAKRSDWDAIPPDIYIRNYGSLKRIGVENAAPIAMERTCVVLWGPTRTGKSRTAWSEAGLDAYPKDPNTKFWDGYRGQKHVVVDEFRGVLAISHLLRWLDRYPVLVDVKFSSTVFKAEKIWMTSNLHPRDWYPELDSDSMDAFLARLQIIHVPVSLFPPQ